MSDQFQDFERQLGILQHELGIPGMSVAIVHRQRVAFARGQVSPTWSTPINTTSLSTGSTAARALYRRQRRLSVQGFQNAIAQFARMADRQAPQ